MCKGKLDWSQCKTFLVYMYYCFSVVSANPYLRQPELLNSQEFRGNAWCSGSFVVIVLRLQWLQYSLLSRFYRISLPRSLDFTDDFNFNVKVMWSREKPVVVGLRVGCSTFMKWIEWTVAMTVQSWQHHELCRRHYDCCCFCCCCCCHC